MAKKKPKNKKAASAKKGSPPKPATKPSTKKKVTKSNIFCTAKNGVSDEFKTQIAKLELALNAQVWLYIENGIDINYTVLNAFIEKKHLLPNSRGMSR